MNFALHQQCLLTNFFLLYSFVRLLCVLCFVQDVANDTYDICDSSVLKKKVVITYGQSVHLGCFVKIPEVLKNQQVTWYHHSKEKGRYVWYNFFIVFASPFFAAIFLALLNANTFNDVVRNFSFLFHSSRILSEKLSFYTCHVQLAQNYYHDHEWK